MRIHTDVYDKVINQIILTSDNKQTFKNSALMISPKMNTRVSDVAIHITWNIKCCLRVPLSCIGVKILSYCNSYFHL